jgi:hypothetical protein
MTSFPASPNPSMQGDSSRRSTSRSNAELGGQSLLLVPLSICLGMIIFAMTLL